MKTALSPFSSSALGRSVGLVFLYSFVFATGATGLIYEVAWQKYLSRLMGSDTMAIAVIMGVFLGGLSLGSVPLLTQVISKSLHESTSANATVHGVNTFGAFPGMACP